MNFKTKTKMSIKIFQFSRFYKCQGKTFKFKVIHVIKLHFSNNSEIKHRQLLRNEWERKTPLINFSNHFLIKNSFFA